MDRTFDRRTFIGSFLSFAPGPQPGGFVLGTYQLPNQPDPWKEVKDAGFHVVRTAPRQAELDQAAKAGMKAWVAVGSDEARIRATVAALKNHSALLFWETEDEPSYQYRKTGPRVTPQRMISAYRAIKAVDTSRPVYVNHSPTNLVSTLRQYNDGADILGTDIYPVAPQGLRDQYALWPDGLHGDLLNPYLSQVGQYADKLREVGGPSKEIYMVLQAFAWEALRKQGDRDEKLIRYPTREELRFMCYQSVIHGASGLLFWGLHTVPAAARFWFDLKAVTRELRDLESTLSAPSLSLQLKLEYRDTGHSLDRGIEWTARPSLLIAVNADRWPVDVTLRGAKGAQRLTFPPFGVALLRGIL
ncbi:MAG: hypothetical protein SFV51_00595 [Bryobacteraceae bacterium]|nr:hypothetical protein [Bryobacteraceae bacterium]